MDTTELERAATSAGIAWACGWADAKGHARADVVPSASVRGMLLRLAAPGFPWNGTRPELVSLLVRAFWRGCSRGRKMWLDA